MSKNKILSAAKSAKNDEFYTQYADIQKEIIAYPDYGTDTFGYNGVWGWNWPNGKWLGHSSISLPGYWMVGEIYETSVVGKVVKTKKTTPEQDKAWLQSMESRVGTKDVYSVGRHNCRAFSQAEFDKAP